MSVNLTSVNLTLLTSAQISSTTSLISGDLYNCKTCEITWSYLYTIRHMVWNAHFAILECVCVDTCLSCIIPSLVCVYIYSVYVHNLCMYIIFACVCDCACGYVCGFLIWKITGSRNWSHLLKLTGIMFTWCSIMRTQPPSIGYHGYYINQLQY